jgi:hypothetical protein
MTENRHTRRSRMRAHAAVAVARKVAPLQVLLVLLGFLALAVQSFVVQTHIHIPQGAGKAQSVSLITLAADAVVHAAPAAPTDKYPINEDPSNCPLCQEIVHSGQFVQSAAILATLPFSVTVHFIVFDEALPSFFAVSHLWHGRAPPIVPNS